MLRLAALLGVAPLLTGCWFIFIPGSVISAASDALSGAEGENCVASHIKVGDRIKLDNGSIGTVKSLSGSSTRCQGVYPVRAKIEMDAPR